MCNRVPSPLRTRSRLWQDMYIFGAQLLSCMSPYVGRLMHVETLQMPISIPRVQRVCQVHHHCPSVHLLALPLILTCCTY